MRRVLTAVMLVAAVLGPVWCAAQQPASGGALAGSGAAGSGAASGASGAPAWRPDDQLLLSGQHSTLTNTSGGEGGSLGYLAQLSADWVIELGGEYQRLATSHWAFGSLSTSFSHSMTAHTRWDVHAEGHEGRGRSASRAFDYSIVAGGLGMTLPGGVAADLEERHINVDTSHGSLPKLTVSKSWGKHWLSTVAYATSFGGNLDSRFGVARLDFYGPGFSLLGGGSVGRVAPVVLNINGVLESRARDLTEEFIGVTKPISRVALTLLGDRIDLAGSRRVTVTLNVAVHL